MKTNITAGKESYSKELKSQPGVLVVTTPIRPVPTEYPPIGSMCVVNSLRKAGFNDVHFYDVDALRPSYEEALEKIRRHRPDVLGISAVVSTAYEYTKRLSLDVKRLLPDTIIILGGNLGASAEIILRKTGVDFIVAGEGETAVVEFMIRHTQTNNRGDFEDVPSLVYLDGEKLVNTGYAKPISRDNVYDIDWTILENGASKINNFFPKLTQTLLSQTAFDLDPRAREEHRKNKTMGTLVASKGCVARCTFCHRWDKSIRYIPVPILMESLREIIKRYNVGFVKFGDENFGTWDKWTKEFCSAIKEFDVLWWVSGMRVNSTSRETLEMMRDAGCSAVYFGMETGSPKMLKVMEKKTKQEQNENTLKWITETGLHTTMQLVLGMPGENWETINETGDFVAYGATLSEDRQPFDISINYAQALPGTPLYEYARHQGIIGSGIDEEEKYLLAISDCDANDETSTLSLTGLPRLVTEQWRPYLQLRGAVAYIEKFGRHSFSEQLKSSQFFSEFVDEQDQVDSFGRLKEEALQGTGADSADYPNNKIDVRGTTDSIQEVWTPLYIKDGMLPGFWAIIRSKKFGVLLYRYPLIFWRLRMFLPIILLMRHAMRSGLRYSVGMIFEYLRYIFKSVMPKKDDSRFSYNSLRKIVNEELGWFEGKAQDPMTELRKGR